ncbi:helix-turn-helix domain-containing protein [Methanogenium cariaci]|uniref:AlbA family DNA-binding domain-containing protein n=1 Tax=Methanogenium cariaci TaxID=2197 RepID=UPI00155DABEE|nr:ATP-binding protein [Methanogenium cariaci]
MKKTPFSRAFPGMESDIIRFKEFLLENNPSIFSEIQIADDLYPDNFSQKSNLEYSSGACTQTPGLTEEELDEIIYSGENDRTEFKETLFGINTGDEKYTSIFKAMKTIAAFMNSNGGNLLIGISDNGRIKGINGDYQIVNKSLNKDRRDAFRLRFDQEFEKYIGNTFCDDIKMDILSVNGKDICRINVKARESPVHIKSQRNDSEKFFVRKTASTVELKGSEQSSYVIGHFR